MAHSFTIIVSDDISSVLKKVESGITTGGGTFSGNRERGSFAGKSFLGMIQGEYLLIAENEIKITITHKPFTLPNSLIESEIRRYFS